MRILRTADDVVAAFGGTKAAAEWAGVGESAVSNWIARGFIPPGWHFRMHEHFEARQYRLESTVFGKAGVGDMQAWLKKAGVIT